MLPTAFQTLPFKQICWTDFGWCLLVSKDYLTIIISFLKTHSDTEYKSLIDIIAIDILLLRSSSFSRFCIKYILLSYNYQRRITLSIDLGAGDQVYSLTNVFPNADWPEREIWDLFGIHFVGHVDLRRLLTDYGFQGHPLLKDFPLSGYKELVYSEKIKRVTFRSVQLVQGYRRFFIDRPWVLS
jgi:NADH-quinone oxidoreductase subunit C